MFVQLSRNIRPIGVCVETKSTRAIRALKYQVSLPEHERPSPANPSLQEHLCPPTVLVQFAFASQS